MTFDIKAFENCFYIVIGQYAFGDCRIPEIGIIMGDIILHTRGVYVFRIELLKKQIKTLSKSITENKVWMCRYETAAGSIF